MTFKQIIVAVVVALLVSAGVYAAAPSIGRLFSSDSLGGAGAIHNSVESFIRGVGIGNEVHFSQSGLIGPGQNQGSWCNAGVRSVGKPLTITRAEVGFPTGIASSTYNIYVATSTGSSITNNFARPAGNYELIDGGQFATSTPGPFIMTSTSTSAGQGTVNVPVGSCVNFLILKSGFSGGCTGATCEAATSTNRGISNFSWYFAGHYTP